MGSPLLSTSRRRTMPPSPWSTALAVTCFSQFAHAAVAHGEALDAPSSHGQGRDERMSMSSGSVDFISSNTTKTPYFPSYFAHPEHAAILYSHIAFMTVAWVFILPIAVMLSISRSTYTFHTQLVFIGINAVGVILATIYNAQTPDLYPNNAHHKLGWIATWTTASQFVVTLLVAIAKRTRKNHGSTQETYRLLSSPLRADEDHVHLGSAILNYDRPLLSTSGHYRPNESPTGSSASSTINDDDGDPPPNRHKEYDEDGSADFRCEDVTREADARTSKIWLGKSVAIASSRILRCIVISNAVVDRVILQFGFITLVSGIATMGRFFEGSAIFAGLAHWIKGGVFFWLGLLTLGRWSGSFGDIGWAWNVRLRSTSTLPAQETRRRWRPSAEFTESLLIFFYGSTNIFLEHLGNWGGSWSSADFEHLAITVLFIGGGACGMIVESTTLRDLLNVVTGKAIPRDMRTVEGQGNQIANPDHYELSLNPIPALVILLLGVMMSSHHQATTTSTMIHKQWGQLLASAAFARGLTYLLIYLRPPTSHLPSRPPTELLASFGLIAGGIIFMSSASDIIDGMINYNLDAMFMYTVTMGLVGLIMAWVLIVLAIKGLVSRKRLSTNVRRI